MSLFWIQGGELSEYEFPDASDAEGEVESLTSAFERLKSNYGSADDDDARPVMEASQIMTPTVITVTESCPLERALALMSEHKIRHLPVISAPGPRVVGIISDRDALLMAADLEEQELEGVTVGEAMTTELLTAAPYTEIPYLARTMVEYKISCLPVLDQDELLVGIVTTVDVLRSIACHAPLNLWV